MSGGRSLVQKSPYPSEPYRSVLIDWEVEAIPAAMGGLFLSSQKYFSISPSDAKRRRWAMNRSMVYMLQGIGDKLLEGQDRLYRQHERSYMGTNYTYTGTGTPDDPYVISPEIPVVPPSATAATGEGVLKTLDTHTLMWYNLMAGYTFPDEDLNDPKTLKQYLGELLTALAGTSEADQVALLQKIVIALGGVL